MSDQTAAIEGGGDGLAKVDAYFERMSRALEGKTIRRVRRAGTPGNTAIDFVDGTTYIVAGMPWNWWTEP